MTTTDWIIDIALVLIVLRQLKEGRIDLAFVALPAGLVYYTFRHFVTSVPTAGNDVVLVSACVAAGVLLGLAGGFATKVRSADGHAYAKAGPLAAGLWVASMGARLGFIVWATHSAGEATLGHFSAEHQITGANVWQTALVLLALSEVVVRLTVIVARGYLKTVLQSEAKQLVTV